MKFIVSLLLTVILLSATDAIGKLAPRTVSSSAGSVVMPKFVFPTLSGNEHSPIATPDGSLPNRYRRVQNMSGEGPVSESAPPLGWSAQSPGITFSPNSVQAVSREIAWMAGDAGLVIKTTDGGASWASVGAAPVTGDLYNITAIGPDTALVTASAASTFIWRTTNGGTTWTQVYTQVGGFINVVHMFNGTTGYAMGDPVGGIWTLLKTADGGATWTPITTPLAQAGTEAGWNNSMSVVGTTHLWFGTSNSRIYSSIDGGETWTNNPVSIAATVSISFLNTTQGICGGNAGSGELSRSIDGGATWTAATPPGSGSVSGSSTSGTRDFWIYQGGIVFRSPDKGVSWDTSYAPVGLNWVDLDFATYAGGDSTSGWVGATNGSIGAFYGAVTPLPPANDIRPIVVIDPPDESKRRVSFSPIARYQNAGSSTQLSIPVRLEILNSVGGVIYSDPSTIASLAAEAEGNVTFASFPIPGTPGQYTARAISASPGDAVTSNDTIEVQFYVPANLSGIFTVGSGGNLATVKAIADTLNENDVAGTLTFELITNGTYAESPIKFTGITYATTPFPVTIKPATGVTAKILVSDPTDIGYAISINNSSNLTIEGSNVLDASTNLTIDADTTVTGVFTTALELNSVRDFTVRNTNIKGYLSTTGASSAVVMSTLNGVANRNVTFENVNISRTFRGIFHSGTSSTNRDTNIVIRDCQLGTVGGSITIASGILLSNVDSCTIENTVVNGIALGGFAGSRAMWGIQVTGASRTNIVGNVVHDINNSQAAANAFNVSGIEALGSSNKIWNNMVWDLQTSSTSTTASIRGIYTKGAADEVYYNSVYLAGGSAAAANLVTACFQLDSIATLKNNVLYNGRTDGTTGRSIALWKNLGAPSLTSDYNLLFAPVASTGKLAAVVATNYADLPAWTTATSQDGNSRRGNPQFANTSVDLHISPSIPTPVEGGATSLSGIGITTDFDGALRHASTPDIGADEGAFNPALANDMTTFTLDDPVVGVSKKSGVAFSPKVTYANVGLNAQTSVGVRFRIYSALNLVTPVYDSTATIASIAAGASLQVTFASATLVTTGDYVARAIVELAGDGNATNDTISMSFKVKNALAGNYTIPSAEHATIDAALSDLRSLGISASVKFLLSSTSYSTSTTLVFDSVAGANATTSVVFKPAPGVNATISGDVPLAPLMLFNGCDYITIDGSNVEGGSSRNLTLANLTSQTVAATIFVRSNGTGRGSTNNTIKNCNIAGGVAQNTATNTVYGIISAGALAIPPTDAVDNDKNKYLNNYFTKLRVGFWARGGLINTNDSMVVSGNVFGPPAFGADQLGRAGIIIQYQNAATISQNEVRFIGGTLASTPTTTSPVDRIGIGIGSDAWPSTATTVNNSIISRNVIHDIIDERGGSTIGISAAASNSAGQSCIISNNMIYKIRSNGSTAGKHAAGIGIAAGNGTRVVYNSVSMSGDIDPVGTTTATQSAAGVRIASATPSNQVFKNNIVSVDITSNTGALNHYAVVAPSAAYAWGTGSSNYNDLYVNTGNSQMNLGGIGTIIPYTNVVDLAAWKLTFTPNQDGASISANPSFTSSTDLHILTNSGSLVGNAGNPVAGVADDYDGDLRDGTTPDMGADEYIAGVSTSVIGGWNLISNPVVTALDSVKQLFPTSNFAYAFKFTAGAGYVQEYRMFNGVGYWEKFPGSAGVNFSGTDLSEDSVDVVVGWNLIGSISDPVDTAYVRQNSVPPNIVISNFFGYAGGYGSGDAILVPGKGYWVKSSAIGKLHLVGSPAPMGRPVAGPLDALNKVTITDALGNAQTLYIGADESRTLEASLYSMPPTPPSGAFDARFESAEGGQLVQLHGAEATEGLSFPVRFQASAYPVMVTWEIAGGMYTIADGSNGEVFESKTMENGGMVEINNSATNRIVIRLVSAGNLPKEFALMQNYPNPFNPTTNIKFALPVASKVNVEIFNLLGQRVRTLVNDVLPAGYHSVEWNGTGVTGQLMGSGVYFVRFTAGETNIQSFSDVRKLMLLK